MLWNVKDGVVFSIHFYLLLLLFTLAVKAYFGQAYFKAIQFIIIMLNCL